MGRERRLRDLWVVELLSVKEIAREFKCAPNTVLREIQRRGFIQPTDKKRCPRCGIVKDNDSVYYPKNGGCCKQCVRDKFIFKHYGITNEDYSALLHKQDLRCAICNKRNTKREGAIGPLHVDHCHKTKRVRGLLCGNCNMGLGKFQDSPDLLLAAIAYLKNDGI